MSGARGPADTRVPDGYRVVLDRHARIVDRGAALVGGAPPRLVHLAPAARVLLTGGGFTVRDATSAALARRMLDAGLVQPAPGPPPTAPAPADVTVVVPVRDRPAGLARLLAALAPRPARPADLRSARLGGVVVVDDGSADPAAIRAVAERTGARVLRHHASRGASAARNAGLAAAGTPYVAFLDSDVVPEPGWLGPLLAAFADPAVALAAPRIVALEPVRGWLGRYEAVRSSLDLGPDAAGIVPRSRVAYVPSAAMLARRDALRDAGGAFDETMHVAEDVDLVLRLHAAGWRLRYVPDARVAHDHRATLRAWWVRKAFYGTGAAPLALRHRGAVPPLVLTPSSAAVGALLLAARPGAALAAALVGAVAVERLARRLTRLRRPRATAARLVCAGTYGALAQAADALLRHHWPLTATARAGRRRTRRTVAGVALVEGLVDWVAHRRRAPGVRPNPAEYLLAHRLDDLAYGTGLWWGALRHRSLEPLRPVRPGAGSSQPRRARPTTVRPG